MKKIGIIVGYNQDNVLDQLPLSYIKALEENNKFLCYLIPSISRNIDDYILKLDGFLIPGGDSDVNSTLYRAYKRHKRMNHIFFIACSGGSYKGEGTNFRLYFAQ